MRAKVVYHNDRRPLRKNLDLRSGKGRGYHRESKGVGICRLFQKDYKKVWCSAGQGKGGRFIPSGMSSNWVDIPISHVERTVRSDTVCTT